MTTTPAGFRCIVAATDFSVPGDAAIARACRLSAAWDARLILLHVIESLPIGPVILHDPNVTAERINRAHDQAGVELSRRIPEEMRDTRPIERVSRYGHPAEEITRVAAEQKADLIVDGACGPSALGRAILGSVTDRVLRQSPISVLVVVDG
jgi:universal stress protein A